MLPLYLGLATANLALLAAAAALGYARSAHHVTFGTLGALLTCAVHCVVFTYFSATGKFLARIIQERGLDAAPLLAEARPAKRSAFRAVWSCIAATMLAAFLGAAADAYRHPPTAHHAAALLLLAANVAAVPIHLRAIRRNADTLRRALR